jgi:hypothetical protein
VRTDCLRLCDAVSHRYDDLATTQTGIARYTARAGSTDEALQAPGERSGYTEGEDSWCRTASGARRHRCDRVREDDGARRNTAEGTSWGHLVLTGSCCTIVQGDEVCIGWLIAVQITAVLRRLLLRWLSEVTGGTKYDVYLSRPRRGNADQLADDETRAILLPSLPNIIQV